MDCGSCARIPYYYLTINSPVPEGESRTTDTAEHHPEADSQICDDTTEAGFTDNESSDDEFFDCSQPEDGPVIMEPVPPSANQPSDAPARADIDSREVAGSESQPPSVETLPQARGMYRLLNLVTERGIGGMSESNA